MRNVVARSIRVLAISASLPLTIEIEIEIGIGIEIDSGTLRCFRQPLISPVHLLLRKAPCDPNLQSQKENRRISAGLLLEKWLSVCSNAGLPMSVNTEKKYRALLVSVGGAPDPVIHVLNRHRADHVWYFCSTGSRDNAEAIQAGLEWRPNARYIEVEQFEELGPCYRDLRRRLPEILKESRVDPSEVLVDYTGGTKTMSAALVLAAVELFPDFSYVGGSQREKAGLGVVVGGKERVWYQGNPWHELAIRDIEQAAKLWEHCLFEAAGRVLSERISVVPDQQRFAALVMLCNAMDARHRLDFHAANRLAGQLMGKLPLLFDGKNDHGLLALVRETHQICEDCLRAQNKQSVLRELLKNTLRTQQQGRYEDAAARLYRAIELQGQIWLEEQTGGVFKGGKCAVKNRGQIPEALRDHELCQGPDGLDVKLSMANVFLALDVLGFERAAGIAAEIRMYPKGRWHAAAQARNQGILAHGVTPVGEDGFNQLKELAVEFLGFDLDPASASIPALDPRWFG